MKLERESSESSFVGGRDVERLRIEGGSIACDVACYEATTSSSRILKALSGMDKWKKGDL